MPLKLIEQQRRLAEGGRIRIGEKVGSGRGRPSKLETFRFTSADRRAIDTLADAYGGTVGPWEGQWQVVSDATVIDVVVPPLGFAFSQWRELWAGGGCMRRCDEERMVTADGKACDQPCVCDPEDRECKPTTRLSVLLPALDSMGTWRLESHGYYAAVELAGAVDLIGRAGRLLPARLLLQQREVKRPGQPTRKFAVPVLDLMVPLHELTSGTLPATVDAPALTAGADVPALPAAVVEVDDEPRAEDPAGFAEQVRSVEDAPPPRRTRASAAALPATGRRPRTRQEAAAQDAEDAGRPEGSSAPTPSGPAPDDEPKAPVPAHCVSLHRRAKDLGLDEPKFRAVVGWVTAERTRSTRELTMREAASVNRALNGVEAGDYTFTTADGVAVTMVEAPS